MLGERAWCGSDCQDSDQSIGVDFGGVEDPLEEYSCFQSCLNTEAVAAVGGACLKVEVAEELSGMLGME